MQQKIRTVNMTRSATKKQTYIETYSRKKEEKLRSYVKPVQTASNERVAMKVIR